MDRVATALAKTTYSELARQTGTTTGFISYLFRGKRSARVGTLEKVAKVLGVGLDSLHQHLKRVREKGAGGAGETGAVGAAGPSAA